MIVFSWNFSPKLVAIRLRALATIIKTSSFRPPPSWSDFFQDASIVTFFVQLHSRIRHNEELAVNSLTCLAQVASVMGDVLGPAAEDASPVLLQVSPTTSRGQPDRRTHDLYVQTFVTNLIDLFLQLHDYEMLPVSVVIYKLITYHPIIVFKRFPDQLMARFVTFLSEKIQTLTGPAMEMAILNNEHNYHEALHNLYQVWRNLLRNSPMFSEEIVTLISTRNVAVVEAFFKSVLAPPYGMRKAVSEDEIREENEDEEDDREVFADLLSDVGYFSLFTLDACTQYTVKALDGRIRQFRSLDATLAMSVEEIRSWQEDMHWLFLFFGFQFQQNSYDCVSNLPEQMAQRCLAGYRSGEYIRVDFEQLVHRCLTQPFDPGFSTERLDPATLLTWYIFSWSVLEHNALVALGGSTSANAAALISPELTRSSLWLSARLIGALSPRDNSPDTPVGENGDAGEALSDEAALLPHIPLVSSTLLWQIIEFVLSKVFTVLTKLPGEERLCADAVQLIIFFADYRAEALARNDHLYTLLAGVDLANLPSRRPLIKSLVIIGSMIVVEEIRDKMYKTILAPLEAKFMGLCALDKQDQSVVGQLADLFDCFAGVADAGQSDAAPVLFAFLKPVFKNSVTLMLKYPDSQLLVNAILDFFLTVADVLFFYIESSEDCGLFHADLLALIDAYRRTQLSKYRGISSTGGAQDELEYQTRDLCTLMEILCHSVSKTFMPTYDGEGSVENSAKVAMMGLELILPLMDEELLKIPTLCATFFRLLLFVSDLAPNVMTQIGETMTHAFLHCVDLALDNEFGGERAKCALEIVNNMATHFCAAAMAQNALLPPIAQHIVALTPKVFGCALQYGSDVDVFSEASNATYSLICLSRESFFTYIGKLLERPENAPNADKIQAAFCKLLPLTNEEPREASRMEKRAFRDRLEKFLTEIYGLLYL